MNLILGCKLLSFIIIFHFSIMAALRGNILLVNLFIVGSAVAILFKLKDIKIKTFYYIFDAMICFLFYLLICLRFIFPTRLCYPFYVLAPLILFPIFLACIKLKISLKEKDSRTFYKFIPLILISSFILGSLCTLVFYDSMSLKYLIINILENISRHFFEFLLYSILLSFFTTVVFLIFPLYYIKYLLESSFCNKFINVFLYLYFPTIIPILMHCIPSIGYSPHLEINIFSNLVLTDVHFLILFSEIPSSIIFLKTENNWFLSILYKIIFWWTFWNIVNAGGGFDWYII